MKTEAEIKETIKLFDNNKKIFKWFGFTSNEVEIVRNTLRWVLE